ncbi:MAG: carbonic anhydrase [Verrucomicrobiota bacterium]
MISAHEALKKLQAGNRRFVSGERVPVISDPMSSRGRVVGQEPFAIILGCSDSRVPVELVFDQGAGDLFVVRVAGNVAAPPLVGSVEFAVERFRTPLVVVLGHSMCGAILATLEELEQTNQEISPSLRAILARIQSSVEPLLGSGLDRDELVAQAVRANICASANALRNGSPLLERLIEREGLLVVGAEYSLETGKVDFFDGIPID